jgi:hypothetical protein
MTFWQWLICPFAYSPTIYDAHHEELARLRAETARVVRERQQLGERVVELTRETRHTIKQHQAVLEIRKVQDLLRGEAEHNGHTP